MSASPEDGAWVHRALARPVQSPETLVAAMRANLAARDFDPDTMFIDHTFARQHAQQAVRLRLSVLLRTYRGDYHTDSYDEDRLVAQVRRRDEFIWFWGSPDQVIAARTALTAPANEPLPELDVGTVTVLSAEEEFGPGHGELCRSGSMDRTVGAIAAILHRMIGYHDGRDQALHRRFHTLLLAARNRATTASVRGGEAVQHIHCQHVRSRFWGVLPFYVMQGGVLECTELRESYRDPQDVRRAAAAQGPWYFYDPADATFAESLWQLSMSAPLLTRVIPGSEGTTATRAGLLRPADPAVASSNHVTVREVRPGSRGLSWSDAVLQAETTGACSVAVHLPLTDAARVPDQRWLAERGYAMVAISPPKHSWQVGGESRSPVNTGATGIWCRPRADLKVVGPHYLRRADLDDVETAVLTALRPRLESIGVLHEPPRN